MIGVVFKIKCRAPYVWVNFSALTTGSVLGFLIYKSLWNPKNHQVHFWNTLQTATILLSGRLTTFFAYIWNCSTSWKSRVGGNLVSELYQKKHTVNVNACVEFRSRNEHFRLERHYRYQPKNVVFLQIQSSDFERGAQIGNVHVHCEIRRKRWRWAYAFFSTIQTLGSHQPSIFKKLKNFICMRKT